MTLSDYLAGLDLLLKGGPLIAVVAGSLIGIAAGLLPGIGSGTVLAVILPLVPVMDPITAIALMVSIYASDSWGGSITATLFNVPGSGGSTATAQDAYPLNQQGRGGEAIAVGRSSAFVGGIVGSVVLMLFAPLVARWALEFGPAEFTALAVFGLTMIAALSQQSLIKGIVSGAFGLLLAAVGQDPQTGMVRFAFGEVELIGGVNLIWVVVGMFAVSQALVLASGAQRMPQFSEKMTINWRSSWGILWIHRKIVILGSLIGTVAGMVPGLGTTASAWISYSTAKRLSPHPEKFGHGAIEGVIAAESASDSVDGGSLIPTMTLGIPGSGGAAIILGGLILAGMHPGPRMFSEQGPMAIAVMVAFVASNLVFLSVAVIAIRPLLLVLRIPPMVWPTLIMGMAMFGAFAVTQSIFGSFAALIIGIVAYAMILGGFPLVPALLGFILGPILEQNMVRLRIVAGDDLVAYILERPIAVVFLLLAFAAVIYDIVKK